MIMQFHLGEAPKLVLTLDRDSVSMGDDCESHRSFASLELTADVSRLLDWLIGYVPTTRNSVWAVCSVQGILGYIVTDSDGNTTTELRVPNQLLTEMHVQSVQCRYYYAGRFSWINGETGERVEKHGACKTLLEKVKKELEG